MLPQMIESFLRFLGGWDMTRRHPPQCVIGTVELLEPALSIAYYSMMGALVDVLFQSIHALPYRHIDGDHLILIDPDAGCVTALRLKPPHKAGSCIRQSINRG